MDILIQSLVTLAGILIAALLTFYFSQRRYTYEKLFDRKLLCLEEIYGKIISLEKNLKRYVHTTGADMSDESLPKKREEIALVLNKFFELQEFFWEKEIILDDSSVSAIQSFIDTSIQVTSKLKTSIISQGMSDHGVSFDQWDSAFQVTKEKLSNAKQQLKRDFRKVMKI